MDILNNQIKTYKEEGAIFFKGVFIDWVETLETGIEKLIKNPSPRERSYLPEDGTAKFFQDLCNWNRIDEFKDFIFNSDIGKISSALMTSEFTRFFHDHVLVKEPGTSKATPWHSDSPYYFVKGQQNVSFWAPLDYVREASLRLVAGSHKWPKQVIPTRWLSEESFYANPDNYIPVPDPDKEGMQVLEFEMEPGDAVAFHYRCLHGARGNHSELRRRAFSLRLLGDDACFTERPGRTSPPFEGHEMKEGDRLRKDWFPILLDNAPH